MSLKRPKKDRAIDDGQEQSEQPNVAGQPAASPWGVTASASQGSAPVWAPPASSTAPSAAGMGAFPFISAQPASGTAFSPASPPNPTPAFPPPAFPAPGTVQPVPAPGHPAPAFGAVSQPPAFMPQQQVNQYPPFQPPPAQPALPPSLQPPVPAPFKNARAKWSVVYFACAYMCQNPSDSNVLQSKAGMQPGSNTWELVVHDLARAMGMSGQEVVHGLNSGTLFHGFKLTYTDNNNALLPTATERYPVIPQDFHALLGPANTAPFPPPASQQPSSSLQAPGQPGVAWPPIQVTGVHGSAGASGQLHGTAAAAVAAGVGGGRSGRQQVSHHSGSSPLDQATAGDQQDKAAHRLAQLAADVPAVQQTLPSRLLRTRQFTPGAQPPAQPDELRLAGLVIHPALSEWYRQKEQAWQAQQQLNEQLEDALSDNPDLQIRFDPHYKSLADQLGSKALRKAVVDFLRLKESAEGPPPGPLELRGVQAVARDVGEDGVNRGRGLVASQDLPAGYVLGVLGGYLLPGPLPKSERDIASLAGRQFAIDKSELDSKHLPPFPGGAAVEAADWDLDCRRYAFQVDLHGDVAAGAATGPPRVHSVTVWGLGYGNLGMLINDPVPSWKKWVATNKNKQDQEVEQVDQEMEAGANVKVVVVHWRWRPIPLLVCTKPIPRGTPLRRVYGLSWWRAYKVSHAGVVDMHEDDNNAEFVIDRESQDSQLPLPGGLGGAGVGLAVAAAPVGPPAVTPVKSEAMDVGGSGTPWGAAVSAAVAGTPAQSGRQESQDGSVPTFGQWGHDRERRRDENEHKPAPVRDRSRERASEPGAGAVLRDANNHPNSSAPGSARDSKVKAESGPQDSRPSGPVAPIRNPPVLYEGVRAPAGVVKEMQEAAAQPPRPNLLLAELQNPDFQAAVHNPWYQETLKLLQPYM